MNIKPCLATVGRSLGAVALGLYFLIHACVFVYASPIAQYVDEPYSTLLAIAIYGVAFGLGIGVVAARYAGLLAAPFSGLAIVTLLSDPVIVLSEPGHGYLFSIIAILVSGLAPLTAELVSRLLWRRLSRNSYQVARSDESRKPENSETREIEN